MSKKSEPSRYLSSFYPTPSSSQRAATPTEEADKFKKPAEFFRSSQQPKLPRPLERKSATSTTRKTFLGFDQSVASTKALELQWTTKMKQAKRAELDVKMRHGPAVKRIDSGKSPLGKSLWGNLSMRTSQQHQQNDAWFEEDVWGEDLPAEAVDQCLRSVTSAEETSSLLQALLDDDSDSFALWTTESLVDPPKPPTRTSLFNDPPKFDDFSSYLSGDDEFVALLANVESEPANLPLSERMPIGGPSKPTFVIKAKEAESPRKQQLLTPSQRKLEKPTKSLPSPATAKLGFTTEWLRGQLEKISTEYSTLKQDVQLREGESKLLREKLKTAEEEVKKHKEEKSEELHRLRATFERKVKHLEKRLEATRTEALFKAKEAESSMEKYRELKCVAVKSPEPPSLGGFRVLESGCRPGEVLADVTLDESVDEIAATQRPIEVVEDEVVEATQVDFVEKKLLRSRCVERGTPRGHFNRLAVTLSQTPQPKRELNHFLILPAEYLPHSLLHTEFCEQEFENYQVRRPTLVELWGTSYNAFGPTALDDYEKVAVGGRTQADPSKGILATSRYFSTLGLVHTQLTALSATSRWGTNERQMAHNVVALASKMARELYATLGDPRHLQTAYTLHDRDPEVLEEFLDSRVLSWDPLSSDRRRGESFVELRRCLVALGHICSVDHVTARQILNPKATAREYFPPPSNNPDPTALKVVVKGGQRASNELQLMQMYRGLHSKNLTFVSSLVTSILQPTQPSPTTPSPESAWATGHSQPPASPIKVCPTPTTSSDWVVAIPSNFITAVNSNVAPTKEDNLYGVFSAPVDRCVTTLERQMLQFAVTNANDLRSLVHRQLNSSNELDLSKYDHEPDVELPKKRKISSEEFHNNKNLKMEEYQTPPFDKTLYTQFQRNESDGRIVEELATQLLFSAEDEQLAKFERREEMAELRRLIEQEEELHKSCAGEEVEAMQHESDDAPSVSDDESSDRPKVGEDEVAVDFVPDLVRDFQRKLQNAGLLETLCEVFKDGGVLRFTHKLSGVLLATVLLLQRIVVHQGREVEPYCGKLGSILREVLYTRPCPRVLLEVNILLRSAIRLTGFPRVLCHNASSETFVIKSDEAHFTRGACLLEVVCLLVTYASLEDPDCQLYFQMIHWVYAVVCLQKRHWASLFELHYANRRRCMCVSALNNTVVTICYRALFALCRLRETRADGATNRLLSLEKILSVGLQVLRLMFSYGSKSFLVTIESQSTEFSELLESLNALHSSGQLRLSAANAFVVSELRRELAAPRHPPTAIDVSRLFRPHSRWPYDLDNVTSLLALLT